MFVLDDSGSICDADSNFVYGRDSTCGNWGFIKQFVYNIVNGMNIGPSATMVGVVRFDSNALVGWTLDAYVIVVINVLYRKKSDYYSHTILHRYLKQKCFCLVDIQIRLHCWLPSTTFHTLEGTRTHTMVYD